MVCRQDASTGELETGGGIITNVANLSWYTVKVGSPEESVSGMSEGSNIVLVSSVSVEVDMEKCCRTPAMYTKLCDSRIVFYDGL